MPASGGWALADLRSGTTVDRCQSSTGCPRDRGHRRTTRSPGAAPRPENVGGWPGGLPDPTSDVRVEDRKPRLPPRAFDEPLNKVACFAPEHVLERNHQLPGQLVHREPEQHVRAGGGGVDLHSVQSSVLVGHRIGIMERGNEGMLIGLCVRRATDPQWWAETENDRHLVLCHLAPARPAGAIVVVAAVAMHDPAKLRMRPALDPLPASEEGGLVAHHRRRHTGNCKCFPSPELASPPRLSLPVRRCPSRRS
jgi:hypothetical protein